jgi:uncharacterized membrane protein YdbT with pleckstrin-like domain
MSEATIYEFHHSWAAWFWLLVLSFGGALPYVWWWRRGTRYEITNSRVIRHSGRLSSSTGEFQLDRVTWVTTHQSLPERLFGVGTITLNAGDDEMTIKSVPKYKRVSEATRQAQE